MAKVQIDATDRKILALLINNARMPFLEIARECGISGAAIHQRIKKLEDSGVVTGSQLIVNPRVMGYDVCAFVGVCVTDPRMLDDIVVQMKDLPEIVEVHFITGTFNMFIKVYCRDNNHLMATIFEKLLSISSVTRTETFISLKDAFERQVSVDEIDVLPDSH